jgi:TPP-dependent trihydroxycyclohexane-1,2-dione (THcHDO) dehydratase
VVLVPEGYHPVAEVSKSESVQKARENYVEQKKNQRYFF